MWNLVRKNFVLISLSIAMTAVSLPGMAANYKDDAAPGLADAAGIWINLWNYPQGDLEAYFQDLKEHGIRNVFLQTSRSNTPGIVNPAKLGDLLEAAHRHGVRILAWSFAELYNPELDAAKMVEAAQYRSPAGEHVDGAAPNLEKNLEPKRIEKYAQVVREKLGANYPLIAVVYSPLNKCFEVKRISWPLLAQYFDVIAPMIYWNSKYEKIEPYSYTVKTIQKIRELSGKADIEISAIGDGMGSSSDAIHEFLRACRDSEATGISLYPNQRITDEQKKAVARHHDYLKPNARFRLAAFREYVKQGQLNPPPAQDPAQSIPRREFYQLLVRQLYPAFTLSRDEAQKHHNSPLPSVLECKEANGETALQILVNLGLVADMSELTSIQGVLDSPIYPDEAVSLIASVLELEQKKLHHRKGPGRRFDRFLVPSAQAEAVNGTGQPKNQALNYIDASHMVLQASSALR
ncbi:MAG: hypothetical protein K2X27_15870 [Candidatus Obscuribacterales bacterium]|nr:hypothetical protein [Candidatus Obscuribacterales bacterium]